MHSVSSNAVAQGLGKLQYLIPLRLERFITSATDWDTFLWIGNGFLEKYQSYPNINGKTKKCNLLMDLYTQENYISVGIKRPNDDSVTVLVNNVIVWGGVAAESFCKFVSVPIDPSFLQAHGFMYIKSSVGAYQVALANVFVEVTYE